MQEVPQVPALELNVSQPTAVPKPRTMQGSQRRTEASQTPSDLRKTDVAQQLETRLAGTARKNKGISKRVGHPDIIFELMPDYHVEMLHRAVHHRRYHCVRITKDIWNLRFDHQGKLRYKSFILAGFQGALDLSLIEIRS